jgi:hypothetical protein
MLGFVVACVIVLSTVAGANSCSNQLSIDRPVCELNTKTSYPNICFAEFNGVLNTVQCNVVENKSKRALLAAAKFERLPVW